MDNNSVNNTNQHQQRNSFLLADNVAPQEEPIEIVAVDVRGNDISCCERVEVRSPSHFHLDLNPNLNRPEPLYEPIEEPSTSTGSSTAPTHWRFKMFKSGSKSSKQNNQKDNFAKTNRNNSSFGEYEFPKFSGKMSDKCFPSKSKNKSKVSPIANTRNENINNMGGSPIGLNVCFGKKLLKSPSNSQTLEFNDRSGERRDSNNEERRNGTATCPRSSTHGAPCVVGSSIYGRLGNTYGHLHVLGSGIGRIERHLSSSCGNIDHYCASHIRSTVPAKSPEGNPRFRIENQAAEADSIYQNPDAGNEEIELAVAGPSSGTPNAPDIKGISKGTLQWLMVNRWLPLWVANTGGKNEYKVIDLDFSIYDNVGYPMCTSACSDENCQGRNVSDTCTLYRRNCLPGGNFSLGRDQNQWQVNETRHFHTFGVSPINSASGSAMEQAHKITTENVPPEEAASNNCSNVDCESPEPDSSAACSSGMGEKYLVGQDSVGENDQELSTADNEQSVSESTTGEISSASDSGSPVECSSVTESLQPSNANTDGNKPSTSSNIP